MIGAGLGGLCLAQGLRRAGVEVEVYERDAAVATRRQGYRLHLDARAGLALQKCLPPLLFQRLLASCSVPSRQFTVLSRRLRVLKVMRNDGDLDSPETLSTSANRLTLREVLLTGLEDRVSFGRELTRYEEHGDTVTAYFADGSSADADVLVGADGVNSAVRRQRLPHAQVVDTGVRCVYGRTPLAAVDVPEQMRDGFTAVVGWRVGMAAGPVRLRNRPEELDPRLTPTADYLMWAVTAKDPHLVDHESARGKIRRWHPALRALVDAATVEDTFPVAIRTSVRVPAWEPSRVTLLGDAIHAMSPARGSGANTALQDAALLASSLHSIGAYEERMREYGFAAVEASLKAGR